MKNPVLFLIAIVSLLTAPLVALSQTVVFSDSFSNGSTLTNTSPAWPTINSTAYEQISSKTFSGLSLAANNLRFGTTASGTVSAEIEALFTTTPVTLNTVGDYVQLTVVFTNLAVLTNTTASQLAFGLFNSGQVKPYPGGLSGTATSSTTLSGYAQMWSGYNAQYYTPTNNSKIFTRPNQTSLTTANNQDLLLTGSGSTSYTGAAQLTGASLATSFTLAVGAVYTEVLTIQLNGANTNSLVVTNSLYTGVGTGGTVLAQYSGTATNATYLTNAFDSLAIGYRGSAQGGALMAISNITVVASVASAPTAPGPTFGVSGGGFGCPGDLVPVTLSGSVTTNTYWLYTNNVFSGVISNGTGNSITFNSTVKTVSITNTIVASNNVSALTGLMSGSAVVSPYPAPTITTQPSAVVVATNSTGVFVVVGSGTGLTYQWHRNGVNLVDGGHITGSTTATLLISPATTADAFSGAQGYYCTVSNSCGLFVNTITNSLTLDASANLVWQGGSPSNIWDVATSPNFTNSLGTVLNFNNGDNVILDDSSTFPIIKAVGYVAPGTLTDTASANNYVIAASSSAITGPGSLIMSGTTTLTISNANNYTGGSTINSGTVTFANYNALGSGTVTLNGGTLLSPASLTGGATSGLSNNINTTASSTLEFDANRSGGQTYAMVLFGTLTGNSGTTLTINHPTGAGPDKFRLYNTNFTLNANLVLNGAGIAWSPYNSAGSQIYGGTISGSGMIWQRGSGGKIVLNGANTYSGGTTLSLGEIDFGSDSTTGLGSSPLGTGALTIDQTSGNMTLAASGGAHTVGNPIVYNTTTNIETLILGGTNQLTLSGTINLSTTQGDTIGTNRTIQVENTKPTTLSGIISDSGLACGIVKTGNGSLFLDGLNTYTGFTTNTAGLLAGSGTIAGNVIVNSGASLGGGNVAAIGTLNISGNLSLNGNAFIRVNKSLAPAQSNDLISVTGTLNNLGSGTVTVTNLGTALAVGDKFKIFSSALTGGNTLTVTGGGMTWTNRLAVDGSIQALAAISLVNTNSTNIVATVTGNQLTLTWPADHTGWRLLQQTNNLISGISSNTNDWGTVAGSTTTNQEIITIDAAKPTEFYQLVYP